MAIKNTRESIQTNSSEERLKKQLKESYKRSINEADDDELDLGGDEELDLGDDAASMGDDMELGGDEGMDADLSDLDGLETGLSAIENLEDTEKAQVNDWVSELLSDSLDSEAIDDQESLDTEASADSLDPMGEDQYINDDVPMTVDELENIINSDDSLSALESALAEMAVEEDGTEENVDDMDMDDISMEDDMDLGNSEDEELLGESHDPMAAINKYFDQGFEGEDVKDDLTEDVDLAPASKEEGFEKVPHGLNDKITSTVKNTTGDGEPVDGTSIIKESKTTSAMLVEAAIVIANQKRMHEALVKQVADLKLESYKLLKTNGLLSSAADMLDLNTRNKISEGFAKCASLEQVNKFYDKITEKLKTANRPSLNEAVTSKKTKINMLKESANKEEEVSLEQQRKDYLMGLPTKDDVYFNF